MDSTAIKLEPCISGEESIAVKLTEIDIEYPFIKKEYPKSISGEVSTTEHSHLEGVTIKVEPGTKEGDEINISFTEIGFKVPNIKKEGLEYSQRIIQTGGETRTTEHSNLEGVTIKAEPGTTNREERELSYTEINIEVQDVKKQSFENSERIHQAADMFPKTHPGKRQHACSQCNYSCSRKSMLELHLRTHTGEKPFSCPDCNYSCNSKGNLKRHMFSHSGEKSFTCTDCNYSCSTKAQLKAHMVTHSEEKPFSCTDCNYSSSSKRNLKSHKFIHGGKKSLSCSDCNFSCFSKGHLKIHMFRHSGEKPFSCTGCSYSCSTKGNLKRHMFTHSGEKPFSCPDCNHPCSTKENLKRHMLTHSGEKL